jgi:amidohydrolase
VKTEYVSTSHIPAVENNRAICEMLLASARALVGEEHVMTAPALTPSDDISRFLARIPGCHFFVGAQPLGGLSDHHAPEFDIDESAMASGTAVLIQATRDLLAGAVPLS